MPTIVMVAIVLGVSGVAFLVWLVLAGGSPVTETVRTNLNRGLTGPATAGQHRSGRWAAMSRRILGQPVTSRLATLIARAGRPEQWPMDRVVGVKLGAALIGLALGVLVALRAGVQLGMPVILVFTALGFFLPDLLLLNTGIKRRQTVQIELPDMLDQMSIAVEAGLGFDAAMVRVARNRRGILADEMVRTLQDIQLGRPRRQSFDALADRVPVPELRRFIRSVVQAEQYGIPLADVLFTQAREMRVARRQRAERKAMQVPVKVVFPLIVCLLPALMLVVMGPAVLKMIAAFTG